MKPVIGWAVVGRCGLYVGWWMTRRETIYYHTRDKGKSWGECRKRGDRAIKVRIKEAK